MIPDEVVEQVQNALGRTILHLHTCDERQDEQQASRAIGPHQCSSGNVDNCSLMNFARCAFQTAATVCVP